MRISFPVKSGAAAVQSGCAVAMGLLFVVAGMLISGLLGWKLLREVWDVRGWPEVACVVEQADVNVTVDGEPRAEVVLRYRYRPGGEWLEGTRLALAEASEKSSTNEIEERCARLRAAPETVCRYRPENPGESYLEKPGYGLGLVVVLAGTFFSLMGLVAVLAGLGWMNGARAGAGMLGRLLFGLAFGLGGLAVWMFGLEPGRVLRSRAERMEEVPCQVVVSRVADRSGSGRNSGPTYRPDIWYRYEVAGRVWHSAWPDFDRGTISTGNASGAQRMVSKYPVGGRTVCHVDPERPWVAVLEKKGGGPWWLWLMALVFGGIGLVVLVPQVVAIAALLRGRRRGES